MNTCQLCGANLFEYLSELQRHPQKLATSPAEWLPNYRETLERIVSLADSALRKVMVNPAWPERIVSLRRRSELREMPVKQRSGIKKSGRVFGQGRRPTKWFMQVFFTKDSSAASRTLRAGRKELSGLGSLTCETGDEDYFDL